MNNMNVKSTRPIKLRDRATKTIVFNLKRDFGFVPEEIIIEKVHGRNNVIVVSAILTTKELDKITGKKDKRVGESKKGTKEGVPEEGDHSL